MVGTSNLGPEMAIDIRLFETWDEKINHPA